MNRKLIFILTLLNVFFSYSQITADATLLELNFSPETNPKSLTESNSILYFIANDGTNGEELWKSDGTENGTVMVKNINPSSSSNARNLMDINNTLFFTANDGTNGQELWKSDGTENGTVMVKNISPSSSSYATDFININGTLFFTANDGTNGQELWKSNGTENGTIMVKNINPYGSSNATDFVDINGTIFFTANDGTNGQELWKSDGTKNGTIMVKNINPYGNSSTPRKFTDINGILFFTANDGTNGQELWKSDGTENGTALVKNIYPSSSSNATDFININGTLFFTANDGINGQELWKSDGTENGTVLVKNINPSSSSNATDFININGALLFSANDGTNGQELWKSDGTENGTVLVKNINQISNQGSLQYYNLQFVVHQNKLYFQADNGINGNELWITDGTTSGTQLLRDINIGINSSYITKLTSTPNYIFFTARNNINNYNTLWKSDGTVNGTNEVLNIDLSQASAPELSFINMNSIVYFSAKELHRTDGSAINTTVVKDINRVYGTKTPSSSRNYTSLNNQLFYTGQNNNSGNEVFVSDGTISGTGMLKDINENGGAFWYSSTCPGPSFTKAGNNLYFRANNGINGYELFKTDGTENGTFMVKDISTGNSDALNESVFFVEYNDVLYFKANDGVFGSELWRSDGTEAGTYLLKDINLNSGNSFFSTNAYNHCIPSRKQHTIFNNLLYFKAFDGSNYKIWKTDGTNGGTVATNITQSEIIDYEIINSNNNKIFILSDLGYNETPKLWASNDNEGATLLYSHQRVSQSLNTSNFVFKNEIYFSETFNNVLMKSDGTLNGTITVKELDDSPTFIGICGSYLYFTVGNKELWRTDGTNTGTLEVGNFTSGNFRSHIIFENTLFILNSLNDKVIYYINDNMDSTGYLNINVLNSSDFLDYDSTWHLSKTNDNLFLDADTQISGDELYKIDVSGITLSVDELLIEQNNSMRKTFNVFPNPSNSQVTLLSKNNIEIYKVEIFNSLGKKVFISTQNNDLIDLSKLSYGLYFLKIYSKNKIETHKVIKD